MLSKAPYNGDEKLYAKESRAYLRYGWQELKSNREPAGVIQAQPGAVTQNDSRTPYRNYAEKLMQDTTTQYGPAEPVVLDLGCGTGLYARLFVNRPGEYHGVDVFEYPEWSTFQDDSPLKVTFHHLRAEDLNQLDVKVNFSLSSSSLEHIDDPGIAIQHLASLTEPGSYGLHIVPGPWTIFTYGLHGWRRFSAEQLQQLFESAGFECVAIYRLGGLPSTIVHALWVTGLEAGVLFQHLTLSAFPFILYRINSKLRFAGARTNPITGRIYRVLLRPALWLDRFLPYTAAGYGIVIRRA